MSRSIEIENIEQDAGKPDIIRQSFRVPLKNDDAAQVTINGRQYPVKDISNTGISIEVEEISDLDVGETFEKCELSLFDQKIENLTARIVHLSNTGEQGWRKGIQWVSLEEKAVETIAGWVSELKQRLLKENTDI